jgi:hypothetical protein
MKPKVHKWEDPIVEEVRSIREKRAAAHGFDIRKIMADAQARQGTSGHPLVSLVLEWAFQHREELLENWNLAERKEDLRKIRPLV